MSDYVYVLFAGACVRPRRGRYLPSRFNYLDLIVGDRVHRWISRPRGAVCRVWSGPASRRHMFSVTLADEWAERMKRRVPKPGDERHRAALETEYLRDHLPILEHCAVVRYDDGTTRQPGWVQVSVQGTDWVLTAKDPDGCVSLTVRAATLDAALDDLALWMTSDDAPWTPDPWLAARGPKKKK